MPSSQQCNPIRYNPPPGNQLCYNTSLGYYHVPIQQVQAGYYNPYSYPAPSGPPVAGPPLPPASIPLPTAPPTNLRPPLGDTTNTAKRTANAATLQDHTAPAKRVRSDQLPPAVTAPSVFGVGPSTEPIPPPAPEASHSSDGHSSQQSRARDVWACVLPADKDGKPTARPDGQSNFVNPKTPKVLCIFCK